MISAQFHWPTRAKGPTLVDTARPNPTPPDTGRHGLMWPDLSPKVGVSSTRNGHFQDKLSKMPRKIAIHFLNVRHLSHEINVF